jgi:dihydrofolate synthase/folylpolyglutamate synthase
MTPDMAYQSALDALYVGYMSKRDLVAGLFDREFKDPEVILGVARQLKLTPAATRTIAVTGSKGKGTTSRLIANYLQHFAGPQAEVGLFVSPEEFAHTDRMKINGAEITRAEFAELYDWLRPHLQSAERALTGSAYLSPFGIFLLIALAWFRRRAVGWHVLETGRGAAHDEVGVMGGELGLITSILNEHPHHLGPGICDIAAEKAAIARSMRRTIVSDQARGKLHECGLWAQFPVVPEQPLPLRSATPRWLALDDRLARQAVASVLPVQDAQLLAMNISAISAAWGKIRFAGVDVFYDAMINLDSLDRDWFAGSFAGEKLLIIYSLPDDKDRQRLVGFAEGWPGAEAKEIVLHGKRGYLSYEEAEKRPDKVCARLHYEDGAGFRDALGAQLNQHAPSKVYCFGTHTFIRLVKAALSASIGEARA